jgi:predicted branched-subunit amino acid permease
MPNMLYRSPWTRWFLAGGGIVAGVIFALGDGYKWRSAPSFRWLAGAPIPLQTWGVLFIVYGILLLHVRTRPVAYALGAVLSAVFLVSLVATLWTPGPKNIFAVFGLFACVVFHVYSIGIAMMIRDASAAQK